MPAERQAPRMKHPSSARDLRRSTALGRLRTFTNECLAAARVLASVRAAGAGRPLMLMSPDAGLAAAVSSFTSLRTAPQRPDPAPMQARRRKHRSDGPQWAESRSPFHASRAAPSAVEQLRCGQATADTSGQFAAPVGDNLRARGLPGDAASRTAPLHGAMAGSRASVVLHSVWNLSGCWRG